VRIKHRAKANVFDEVQANCKFAFTVTHARGVVNHQVI
jgi:hypothetical protein